MFGNFEEKKRKLNLLPRCDQLWKDSNEAEEHIHRCRSYNGHRNRHKCNCGKTKDILPKKDRLKLGGGKKG